MGFRICKHSYLGLDNTQWKGSRKYKNTVVPGYNKIGFYDASPKESDILCYRLIPHC